ncbi:phage tail tape measure protein [Caldimonas manganoxidans]|uniref:phage tail tape measure protein n=1 Tax=Caldimonas manganoxidans TaxID=196015 RepID=UPI00035DA995|nr:phage tail tape measure protein [Caldimonas manganoxidans]
MAQEFFLGIKLGAIGASAVGAALGSAQSAMTRLGDVAKSLTREQERLGEAVRRHMGTLAPKTLASLNRDYERLGQTIDAVRARQEKLGAAMSRRQALADQRGRIGGEIMGTYATALAVGAPVIGAVREAAGFGDAVKDIAIVGELTAAEEKRLGASLRAVALNVNQTAEDMARGVGLLIANGMEAKAAAQQAQLLGRFTTATRASFEDAAKMMVSFSQLGVSADQMALAFSQAAKAGKLGSFEVRDMARWFPQLGGYLKAIGITGNEAVVNMASRLQVAMKTAGSTDEAANNFRNFLAKLTSPDTVKDFEKLGLDLQGSMLRLARQGLDPIEGAVGMILQKVGQRAPEVTRELEALSKELASIKDPAERAAEMERRRAMIEALGQRAGLGQMFQDMQAVGYLLAEIQNRDDLKRIRAEVATGKNADGQMSLDADFAKRLESPVEQMKAMRIAMSDMAMAVGDALLPALNDILQAVKPVVLGLANWAKEHPALIKGAVGFALGLATVKAATLSLGWGLNFFVKSPIASLQVAWQSLASRALMARAALLAGSGGFKAVALAAGLSEGLIGKLGAGLVRFRAVAVAALTGAGRALMWLGRAVMLNPIGLALTAIAGAAYLVWRNWDVIGPKLAAVWQQMKAGFVTAWAWLKGLPDQMLALGREIVAGLIDGIKARIAAAGEAVTSLGETIKSKFKGWLGIRSPSRVFAEFGQMIGLGAAQGIAGMGGAVARATAGLALAATGAFNPVLAAPVPLAAAVMQRVTQAVQPITLPTVPDAVRTIRERLVPADLPQPPEAIRAVHDEALAAGVPALQATLAAKPAGDDRPSAEAAAPMTITFAPVIHVTAAHGGDVKAQVQEAARLSFAEFERLMRRWQDERRRLSPMGGLS